VPAPVADRLQLRRDGEALRVVLRVGEGEAAEVAAALRGRLERRHGLHTLWSQVQGPQVELLCASPSRRAPASELGRDVFGAEAAPSPSILDALRERVERDLAALLALAGEALPLVALLGPATNEPVPPEQARHSTPLHDAPPIPARAEPLASAGVEARDHATWVSGGASSVALTGAPQNPARAEPVEARDQATWASGGATSRAAAPARYDLELDDVGYNDRGIHQIVSLLLLVDIIEAGRRCAVVSARLLVDVDEAMAKQAQAVLQRAGARVRLQARG